MKIIFRHILVSALLVLYCAFGFFAKNASACMKHAPVNCENGQLLSQLPDSTFSRDMKFMFEMIEKNPNDTIVNILSRIIEGTKPPVNRQIAMEAYNYFINPSYMGQEAVAVEIAKKFIAGKFADSISPDNLFSINTYINLIEPSLVGKRGQNLTLYNIDGKRFETNNIKGFKVIFFYTDDCATCKIETPLLAEFLKAYSGVNVSLIAVYANPQDASGNLVKERWREYSNKWLSFKTPSVTVYNLWDPELESSFPLKYAVISTPQMYLLSDSNIILGRSLKTDALKQLLSIANAENNIIYSIFNKMFSKHAVNGTLSFKQSKEAVNEFVNTILKGGGNNGPDSKDISGYVMPKLVDYLYDFEKLQDTGFEFSFAARKKLAKFIKKKYLPILISLGR